MQLTKAIAFAIRTLPPNFVGYYWYLVKLETESGLVGWGRDGCAVQHVWRGAGLRETH